MERTEKKKLKKPLSIYINKNYSNNKISSNNTYCCIIKE